MKEIKDFVDKIIQGDTLEVLKQMPDNSVDCIITSPPYWGLRDYGENTNKIWGGDPNCEHEWGNRISKKIRGSFDNAKVGNNKKGLQPKELKQGMFCKKCGAWYGQLGLEPNLEMYIEHLLEITAELKRVLKPTGVMFWNHDTNKQNLCDTMQNYRLIIKMIDEQGWIIPQKGPIIWYKPNHMPDSFKRGFTHSYEPVFMLVKSKKYWFDLDAVRVPHKEDSVRRAEWENYRSSDDGWKSKNRQGGLKANEVKLSPLGKNPGDVWEIPTQPFPDAHFATFPERLVEPMIKAGCPQWICKKCGKARVRITRPTKEYAKLLGKAWVNHSEDDIKGNFKKTKISITVSYQTIGWTDCGCNAGWEAGIVLDPFAGSGTTCYVARKLGRHFIGIEINPKYVKMARKRLAKFGEWLDKFIQQE